MIVSWRRLVGWAAILACLVMGVVLYVRVLPGADWYWPPDFQLTGYDASSIAPFLDALIVPARDSYARVLALYGLIDLADNAAILRVLDAGDGLDGFVAAAHHFTMAKLASLYLCGLVLVVHLRRSQT
ncbi:hypothetical protein OAN307_c39590 [Octadecabacter antarcticus 307]|uniref:Uncharacterized protein n=1 Tax=Octadecabacter antarcticus 307 TaxID=391626 RepID=M9RB04_9RHOB|nr:hypothetical protein [Octadecabacter antarcticus]AGI69387.1 hypothetical protein OAN307_c39590 [Octadecabacter antarcticus 307]